MIKKNLKVLIVTSLVILLPILAGVVLWDRLPSQIPAHWNLAGEVDGWSSKPFTVFGMPLIMLAVQWLCVFVSGMDPKKPNHSGKVLQLMLWIIPVLSVLLHTVIYMVALEQAVRIEVVMPVFMGLLFAIIGNYLPKCKQNYTIGLKMPWSLNSEENWNRTHRFAGKLWVVCGLAIILTGFFDGIWLFFTIVLLMVLAPFVYSYTLHRKGI